jgi:hypothetical protein
MRYSTRWSQRYPRQLVYQNPSYSPLERMKTQAEEDRQSPNKDLAERDDDFGCRVTGSQVSNYG